MAKTFKTLLRIRKWALDEKRRELGEMLEILAKLEAEKADLEARHIREQKIATANPEIAGFTYGGYAAVTIKRRAVLDQRITEQEKKIEAFRDEVAEAFKEMKTVEIAERNRVEAERAEEDAKEQAQLDEIGMRSAVRKKDLL